MSVGERFEIRLDQPADGDEQHEQHEATLDFVGDIQERQVAAPKPPSFPSAKSNTGFPAHIKRDRAKQSQAKRQINGASAGARSASFATKTPPAGSTLLSTGQSELTSGERQQIHHDNEQRLAAMSEAEIEEARSEIIGALDPSLLQRLLMRSDIGSGSNEARSIDDGPAPTQVSRVPLKAGQRVAIDDDADDDDDDYVPTATGSPVVEAEQQPQHAETVHFPRAPQPPELDPNSATFLDDLHSKYFPSLPSDPDKLEWMRTPENATSSYDPSQAALSPGEIRFDFKGALIPPTRALNIPVSAGLHHHGDAPDAAGYTIPELAHLSRSTYAPQRCVAFQTLGRILFKLGRGEFGDPGEAGANTVGAEDTFGELARGLWREVEGHHVIHQLVAESEGNGVDGGRHVSARAYATEAVWLWQKGGGRRWKTS